MNMLERMLTHNPWWEGRRIESLAGMEKRDAFHEINKYMKTKQIIFITGLRRVGKTVLARQLIESLLPGTDPRRILYFSFDEMLAQSPDIIEDVLQMYETEILKSEMENVYVFFDEINHIPSWQVILKRFYDLEKHIKFVVTGSAGIQIKRSAESLAGRIYEFNLKPLSFSEFLRFRKIAISPDLSLHALMLQKELPRYLMTGGFPEISNETDFEKTKMYVSGIADKVIFSDIPKSCDVGNPEILKEIFRIISNSPGSIVEYKSLASSLKVTYQTISKYVHYLESTYLIKSIYNKRGSPVAMSRKAKKIYLTATSLALASMDSESQLLSLIPRLAENAVAIHSSAKYFLKEYYELDFVNKVPIEVKYSANMDISNNIKAALKIKAKELLVITKNYEDSKIKSGIKIKYVPLWKWLLQ